MPNPVFEPDNGTHLDSLDRCWQCRAPFLAGTGCAADDAYCSEECLALAAAEIRADELARREAGR